MENLIYEFLENETIYVSLYTGGGDEPRYVCFEYSEDQEKEKFLKDFAVRLTQHLKHQ